MNFRVIGFIPPIIGTEGEFNTFRLGGFYHKNLSIGETVLLLNEKEKMVFGRATVQRIGFGKLGEMLALHAATNHTEIGNDSETASERLGETIRRIYGPHIATPNKKTTVIFMKRTE
ncbi:MAG: hypothetical protein FWF12_00065 [Betaproteobacteria bacterium]|nr:hypothetical protein [Betaproteobacteria bacterium]